MMIQEPVTAGDVRLSKYGPAVVERLATADHGMPALRTATGQTFAFLDMEVAAMPLLCPAHVRVGDEFAPVADGPDEPIKLMRPYGDAWQDEGYELFHPRRACLEHGCRIVARGPVVSTGTGSAQQENDGP